MIVSRGKESSSARVCPASMTPLKTCSVGIPSATTLMDLRTASTRLEPEAVIEMSYSPTSMGRIGK